jgi:glycosyltransferase involved in cell wall biosynthesis
MVGAVFEVAATLDEMEPLDAQFMRCAARGFGAGPGEPRQTSRDRADPVIGAGTERGPSLGCIPRRIARGGLDVPAVARLHDPASPPAPGYRRMKLLEVIRSVDLRGGGPIEGARSRATVWRGLGHHCEILSLDAPGDPWVTDSEFRPLAVGPDGPMHRFTRRLQPWLRYGYAPKLTGWLAANAGGYDAVIVNGLWNYASLGSWRALRKLDVPYFVFAHGMLDPWFNKAYPTKALLKGVFWRLFENRVLRDARGVLFTSEEERVLARTAFAPYAAREFVVGHGARDVDGDPEAQKAAFAARVPGVRGRRFVLFLGRIHPKKGVDMLIQAFGRLASAFPAFDLVVAGPDQSGLVQGLKRLAAEAGVADRIHWTGMLAGDVKWGAFRCAEFFALPSHQENFGVVVAEALALATPVLITDKVNIWREIEMDAAGVVVPDDVEGIAAGLARMCALSGPERGAMAANARAAFLARFDLRRNAIDLLALVAAEASRGAPE